MVHSFRQQDAFAARAVHARATASRSRRRRSVPGGRRWAMPAVSVPSQGCDQSSASGSRMRPGMQRVPPASDARAGPVEAGFGILACVRAAGVRSGRRRWPAGAASPAPSIQRRSTRARRSVGKISQGVEVDECCRRAMRTRSAHRRLRVQQVGSLRAQRRAAREVASPRAASVRAAAASPVAQEIAVEAGVRVAGVFDPAQTCACAWASSCSRGTSSNGRHSQPCACARHGRIAASPSAPEPRSARSRKVSAWSSRWWASARISPSPQRVRERAMARVRARRLRSRARARDPPRRGRSQRHAQRVAVALAMRGPVIGVGVQSVVDMDARAGRARRSVRVARQQVQQDGRNPGRRCSRPARAGASSRRTTSRQRRGQASARGFVGAVAAQASIAAFQQLVGGHLFQRIAVR